MIKNYFVIVFFIALISTCFAGTDSTVIKDRNSDDIVDVCDGALCVFNESDGLSIARGRLTGVTFIHKFGQAPDFDISNGDVTVWDGANDAGIDQMVYQYSTTANIDSLISTDASDTQSILILGLNSEYNEITQNVTLTGQTRAALGTKLIRIYRMINEGSTDLSGVVSCYVNNAATSAGVVSDSANVRAIINNGNNQTLLGLYTVPAGKTAYMRDWYASLTAKKTAIAGIKIFARPFGQVFQLKHTSDINSAGSSHTQHKYNDPIPFKEKTDIEMRASTSVDSNGIAAGFDLVLVDN